MKQLNVRVVLFLGGILLVSLGVQYLQIYSVENFTTDTHAAPADTHAAPAATPARPAVAARPTDSGNITAATGLYMSMPSADKKIILAGVKSAIKLNAIKAIDNMMLSA